MNGKWKLLAVVWLIRLRRRKKRLSCILWFRLGGAQVYWLAAGQIDFLPLTIAGNKPLNNYVVIFKATLAWFKSEPLRTAAGSKSHGFVLFGRPKSSTRKASTWTGSVSGVKNKWMSCDCVCVRVCFWVIISVPSHPKDTCRLSHSPEMSTVTNVSVRVNQSRPSAPLTCRLAVKIRGSQIFFVPFFPL